MTERVTIEGTAIKHAYRSVSMLHRRQRKHCCSKF
jgi:hypothetical protein